MIADYASKNVFLETKPVHLQLPPIEHERFGGSSLDYAYEQGFPLTYGLEVFEVDQVEKHIRNLIADRVFVGWSGVFNLAKGALKYKCNVPREDKCRCFEEKNDDESHPEGDRKFEVLQNFKSGSSPLINGKSWVFVLVVSAYCGCIALVKHSLVYFYLITKIVLQRLVFIREVATQVRSQLKEHFVDISLYLASLL